MDIKLTPDDWEKFAKEHDLDMAELIAEMSVATVTMLSMLKRLGRVKEEPDADGNLTIITYGHTSLIYREEKKH